VRLVLGAALRPKSNTLEVPYRSSGFPAIPAFANCLLHRSRPKLPSIPSLETMVVMLPDETPPRDQSNPLSGPLVAANDAVGVAIDDIDPHIRTIAQAIGRQIAREELDARKVANDNSAEDLP
jgi:hypothetical protein